MKRTFRMSRPFWWCCNLIPKKNILFLKISKTNTFSSSTICFIAKLNFSSWKKSTPYTNIERINFCFYVSVLRVCILFQGHHLDWKRKAHKSLQSVIATIQESHLAEMYLNLGRNRIMIQGDLKVLECIDLGMWRRTSPKYLWGTIMTIMKCIWWAMKMTRILAT